MKKIKFVIGAITLLTFLSCSSDDGKVSCSELNIFDQADRPCDFYAEEFNCSCG